ncbi:MAG: reverse transcriptase/maturase family protein [bacterium]|nr:reverse transcriptase/maturase family protein [bacterium]
MNDRQIQKTSRGGVIRGNFHEISSLENLFSAWREFKKGKTRSADVQAFMFDLEKNIFELHEVLQESRWQPDSYISFYVRDPKLRHIHKASVRDRVLYQAMFRVLYPVFDPLFIHDSYSCRRGKGTHAGVFQLERYLRKVSGNYHEPVYALKCDVRKFFDSISHEVLLEMLRKRVDDAETTELLQKIIFSFEKAPKCGLPLGNVTSQLFANIYLNELDQFMKHQLHIRYYLRYCDDFIILGSSVDEIKQYIPIIRSFLDIQLGLTLHPNKVSIRKILTGVDFLGYITLPHYRVIRTSTHRRIFRKLNSLNRESYIGITTHAKGYCIKQRILKLCARGC